MHSAIEYISAGVIIFLILGATGQYTTNMVYDRINMVERGRGIERADKIIDMLLLSPGSPLNWAEELDEPESMGLAFENAIKVYQLDSAKVRRLDSNTTGYIPPHRVRDLLGLSAYYYLSIRIIPIFNVTATKLSDERFSVRVVNQWNVPVSNINVTAAYTNIANVTANDIVAFMDHNLDGAVFASNITSAVGICTLNFAGAGSRATLLVLASRFSVKTLVTWPSLSEEIVGDVESSMGIPSSYNVETVYRNVEIDGLNYIARLTMWS